MIGGLCGGTFRYLQRFGKCRGACGIEDAALSISLSWSPYYGDRHTCTNCGDMWAPGEGFYDRPFQRGWRAKNIARALVDWDNGCDCERKVDEEMYLLPCEHQ